MECVKVNGAKWAATDLRWKNAVARGDMWDARRQYDRLVGRYVVASVVVVGD